MAAATARALVGTRFRPHGRGGDGLDCVGLAAAALAGAGVSMPVPTGYRLTGGRRDEVIAALDARLDRVTSIAAGDVLLLATGPVQLHLAIATGCGLVHACARARRVVERPGTAPWPPVGAWRIREEQPWQR